jgi:PQQ-dependent catabolism-associated CXXCW motif protein
LVSLTFFSLLFYASDANSFLAPSVAHKQPELAPSIAYSQPGLALQLPTSNRAEHPRFFGASDAHKHPRLNFSRLECCVFFDEMKTVSSKAFSDFPPYNVTYRKGRLSKNSILAGEISKSDIYQIASTQEEALRFPDEPPVEPDDYRMNKYREIVPTTLKGATVVNSVQAKELYEKKKTLFIDVMPYIPKPPNLPKTMIWREKIRKNIEDSSWLANVGYGALPPEMTTYFKSNLKKLTSGNLSYPLLFYCQQQCWMSWNAAKRALEYGYSSVYWFPRGTDGWLEIGGTVKKAIPVPLPNMTRRLTQ